MKDKQQDTMNDKLDMSSPDLVNENLERLAALFPNCVTETENGREVDFDLLRQELSHAVVEGNKERYRLEWPGKREAIVTANLPTTNTLRPIREDSLNFDTTENLYIEGDNLEVLKLLQESYLGKIKMIYIDPPYNTGKDFVYKDNFSEDKLEHELESGQRDDYGKRLVPNPETSGRYHSDWLSMMYPRLKLARNLLMDDGVIVIHIDEHELSNLEKVLREIFGEVNNLGTIVWDKRNPKGEVSGVAQQHEYLVIFSKNRQIFNERSELKRPKENAQRIIDKAKKLVKEACGVNDLVRTAFKNWLAGQSFTGGEKAYNLIDRNGQVYQTVSMAAPDKPETRSHRPLIHPVSGKPCPVPAKGWRFPDKTMDVLLDNGEIIFGNDESSQPRRKYLLIENLYENVPSLLYFGGSDNALSLPFDNPKPLAVAKRIIESVCSNDDIILDFFAGSSTTAHAVMKLNAEDEGNRKFIMVQLPEPTDEKSEAFKAGYKNIAEIGKDRIRRAGKKILEELKAEESKQQADNTGKFDFGDDETIVNRFETLDVGFRVFRLDSSNMQDVYYRPQDYSQEALQLFEDNVKSDRTPDDLLAQVMLDWGLPLSLKIEQADVLGKRLFKVAANSLFACFDEGIDEDFAREIAREEPLRIVFRDRSFKDDTAKENVKQLLKQLSPETEMKVI